MNTEKLTKKISKFALYFVIRRFYMIGIALTNLITEIIGLVTIGYYMPKFELKLAMKYAQWNFRRKQNGV